MAPLARAFGQVLQGHELEFCSSMNCFQAFFELAQTTERIFLLINLLSQFMMTSTLLILAVCRTHVT